MSQVENYVVPWVRESKSYSDSHMEFAWDHPHILRMMSNENPLPPSQAVLDAILETAKMGNLYPASGLRLRQKLGEASGLSGENVILGNGSADIINIVIETFAAQDAEQDRVMKQYNPVRTCMDQTGMGEKPVEDARRRYGDSRVEGVLFSAASKLDMAGACRRRFEDRGIRIPHDRKIRDDLHSVKKVVTSAGNIRFDAERSGDSHADRFWALCLAVHAATDGGPEPRIRLLK